MLFIQTSDQVNYLPMLETTAPTIRAYCKRHGASYDCFIGVKRGFHPWQATYNRIPMLVSLVKEGCQDWVCYMDADAYIADLDFDLPTYLSDKGDIAFIGAQSGEQPPRWWDMNIGVFMINLGSTDGRELVFRWDQEFQKITEDQMRAASKWDEIENDQNLFHEVLRNWPEFVSKLHRDDKEPRVLNWQDARFIRQVLRSSASSFADRLNELERCVAEVIKTCLD